jgi:hypothetical protein
VKAVVYSGPGLGKTPLLTTAPNPVICFTEPGFLSVRKYNGPCYPAFTYREIREFWQWAISSQEARQFGTFCCDSVSQMAEIILEEAKKTNKDGRKAYGELVEKAMEIMNWIYYAPNFNALLIAKEQTLEIDGANKVRPYFPGQELNIRIPHLFDSVWRLERINTPQGLRLVIRTKESFNAFARERSGNLAEFEAPDINALFAKSLQ